MTQTIIQPEWVGNSVLIKPDIPFSVDTLATEGDDALTTEIPDTLITEGT